MSNEKENGKRTMIVSEIAHRLHKENPRLLYGSLTAIELISCEYASLKTADLQKEVDALKYTDELHAITIGKCNEAISNFQKQLSEKENEIEKAYEWKETVKEEHIKNTNRIEELIQIGRALADKFELEQSKANKLAEVLEDCMMEIKALYKRVGYANSGILRNGESALSEFKVKETEIKKFKCYEIHRSNIPQYGCVNQCKKCEIKEGKETEG